MILSAAQKSYFSVSTYTHPYNTNFTQISSNAKLSVWKIIIRFYPRFHAKQSLLQKQLLPPDPSWKINTWVSTELTPHLNNQYVQVSQFQKLLADQINYSVHTQIYFPAHRIIAYIPLFSSLRKGLRNPVFMRLSRLKCAFFIHHFAHFYFLQLIILRVNLIRTNEM